MPREARNPAATWAPFPPPHMVTWRGFQPSVEALKRSCSALAWATDRVILSKKLPKVRAIYACPYDATLVPTVPPVQLGTTAAVGGGRRMKYSVGNASRRQADAGINLVGTFSSPGRSTKKCSVVISGRGFCRCWMVARGAAAQQAVTGVRQ